MSDRTIGIVGAGAMGAGIAQVALEAGETVRLHDVDSAAIDRALARIRGGLSRRAAHLNLDAGAIDDWVDRRLARLRPAASITEVAADADLVIEAALEDLDLKRDVFAALAGLVPPDAILATNTSALSVTAIAAATNRPDRVLGLHFFNPAPVMALVEVVVPAAADEAVVTRAMTRMRAWGKTPVRCSDSPGFIVNRVNRPFTIEALRMLERGEASIERVDAAMRAAGFPMGPFELMDFTGIDVNLAAARGVWKGLGRPDRLRPSPILERLVVAGTLGRKTGMGFYRYDPEGLPVALEFHATSTGSIDLLPDDAIVRRITDAIDFEVRLAVEAGVATANDIAIAVRLGARHPGRDGSPGR